MGSPFVIVCLLVGALLTHALPPPLSTTITTTTIISSSAVTIIPPSGTTIARSGTATATATAAMNETELLRFEADKADKLINHLESYHFDNQTIRMGGDWLLFIGSQTFTPKFLSLQQNKSAEYEKLNFKLAKLSCTKNKETCLSLVPKLTFYPSMRIYKDGEFYKEFDGDDEIKPVTAFIEQYLDSQHGEEAKAVKAAKLIAAGNNNNAAQKKLDSTTTTTTTTTPVNPLGTVFKLDSKNINSKLEESAWIVKFYSPFCSHCIAFAPTWVEVAQKLKGTLNVGEVDCTVEKELCKKYEIMMFPSVVFIGAGEPVTFKGTRTLDNLLKFATDFMASSFNAVSKQEVSDILHSNSSVSIFYIYDFKTTPMKLVENFAEAAALSRHVIQVNVCPDPKARALFPSIPAVSVSQLPLLIVSQGEMDHKDTQIFRGSLNLDTETSRQNVKNWIIKHSKPVLLKLDETTSRSIMDGKNTVVLLVVRGGGEDKKVALQKTESIDTLREAARRWQNGGGNGDDEASLVSGDRDGKGSVVFAWIDANGKADYLQRAFGIKVATAEFPLLLIINSKEDMFFDVGPDGVGRLPLQSADEILENLDAVFAGKLKGKEASGRTGLYRLSKSFADFMKRHPLITLLLLSIVVVGLIRWAFAESDDYAVLGRIEPKSE
ncbi:hypothetical protein CcCBS67573_g07788 [Chytriomyces confervae]|uniref:Thioredoxin domain-containing protein n=1 Tax=Chytriomyces confervae TaxID=246404 RepID=A0A507ETH0_9FUNG|nr:hypothetical protein CcCBS67573_g07788 [Chytriomyces confervae]